MNWFRMYQKHARLVSLFWTYLFLNCKFCLANDLCLNFVFGLFSLFVVRNRDDLHVWMMRDPRQWGVTIFEVSKWGRKLTMNCYSELHDFSCYKRKCPLLPSQTDRTISVIVIDNTLISLGWRYLELFLTNKLTLKGFLFRDFLFVAAWSEQSHPLWHEHSESPNSPSS